MLREISKETVFTAEYRSTSPNYFLNVLRRLSKEAPPNIFDVTLSASGKEDIIPGSELWLAYSIPGIFLPTFPSRPGDFESDKDKKKAKRDKFLTDLKEAALKGKKIEKISYWSTWGGFNQFMEELEILLQDGTYHISEADLRSPDAVFDTGVKLRHDQQTYFARLLRYHIDTPDRLKRWVSIFQTIR